ncbi:MAG: DUF1573 domain-containing protein [Planctomycetaceae bacterium]|nr:DUF1573 domain-containing protein [Planctomycetaceae bacterium]
MFRPHLTVMGTVLAACGLYACSRERAESQTPTAQIHVRQQDLDLGETPLTGEPLLMEYEIENWGTAPLRIEGTILSCGCTRPEIPDSEILPDESALVRLRIQPEAAGEKTVRVTLVTNDPVHPRFPLTAHWIATNGITIDPTHASFGDVEPGEPIQQILRVSKQNKDVEIRSVAGEPAAVQAEMNGDELLVTLVPQPYPVQGRGTVRVAVDKQVGQPVLIPVTWHVNHAYEAHPTSLFLGFTKPAQTIQGQLSIRNQGGDAVLADSWEWREELSAAVCEATTDQQGEPQLTVRWEAPEEFGRHQGTLVVHVESHELLIPVSAFVGQAAP